jgi:hypothetical protein
VKSNVKGKIVCKVHGEFWQVPSSHLQGSGCPKCAPINRIQNIPFTTRVFIDNAIKLHGSKYDYSNVKYINAFKRITIICPLHGIFFQSPKNHLCGRGCPVCGHTARKSINEFIARATTIHNNFYDYSRSKYTNSSARILIICPKHGKFYQSPNKHLMGQGCPKCRGQISKLELNFLDYLKIPNTHGARQVCISRKRVDGYDDTTNTIYEFLGDYFHGNPSIYNSMDYNPTCHKTFGELYENTIQKLNILKDEGYNVKYIWEDDWKRFSKNIDSTPKIIEY